MANGFSSSEDVFSWSNNEKLYLNAQSADVFFTFQLNGEKMVKIPAHKNILASISPIFDIMFRNSTDIDIPIFETTPQVFQEFLQFFYLSQAKLACENLVFVKYLCKKYKLNECTRMCVNLIKTIKHLEQ